MFGLCSTSSTTTENLSSVFSLPKKVSTQHIEIAEFFRVFLLRQVGLYLLGPYCEKLLKVDRFEINNSIKIQLK